MSKANFSISLPFLFPSIVLTLAFIILKLADVIDWSWWWVCFPVILSGISTVLLFIVLFVWFLIYAWYYNKYKRNI